MEVPAEIKRHAVVLRSLARSKPRILKQQITQLPTPVINTIRKLSRNYLNGNIRLTKAQLAKIRRHKRVLRELALSKTSLKRSKHLLQKGGFLSSLLIPLVGLFASLVGK